MGARPPRVLRRPLGRGPSLARVLAAARDEPGLVALSGAWLAPASTVTALVAWRPRRVLVEPGELVAALDDVPTRHGGPDGAAFGAGWLGLLGYGLARHLEPVPPPAVEAPSPAGFLGWYEAVWCQEEGEWFFEALVEEGREAAVLARYDEDRARLAAARGPTGDAVPFGLGPVRLEPSLEGHAAAVAAVIEAIEAGDVFQVNACCQLVASFEGDPVDLFAAGLERLRPRFGAFLRRPDGHGVCSFSPELFVKVTGRRVQSSPIKGTAHRPADPEAADAARAALVASAKDGAENAMIVDLVRNDLGRVCLPGSVHVAELGRAEAHPGVWHLVSDVVGELAEGEGNAGVVKAAFPAGSITGAPKIRAMELVAELEPVGRGAYTGSIGFVSPLAGMCLNVAIRTFEVVGGTARLGVGGGVVADSSPGGEVAECLTKARPLLEAVGGELPDAVPPAPGDATLRPRPATGVFETMRVVGGGVPLLERHLERLAASAVEVLGRSLPVDLPVRLAAVTADREGVQRLRVAVSPGGATLRVALEIEPLGAEPAGPVGLEPVVLPGGLGRHKWCDRRLLAGLRPPEMAAGDQLLLVDDDGSILEAERASLFCVVDGLLRTPGLEAPILPGVARALVLAAAAERGLAVKEGPVGLDELSAASEAFVTNALRGLQSVGRVGTSVLATCPGPVASLLAPAVAAAMGPDRPAAGPAVGMVGPLSSPGRARGEGRGPGGELAGPVVLLDNLDSFTYNLSQALAALGASTVVVRSNEVDLDELADLSPAALVLSPGPCGPAEAGISVAAVRRLGPRVPTLGVCLGHQCIAAAYGASVVRAPAPVHGKTSPVDHDGSALFEGVPSPFSAARYHSLVVDPASLPAELVVSAWTGGIVMGLRHRRHPVLGVQFHPESFLTDEGGRLLENFLRWARS